MGFAMVLRGCQKDDLSVEKFFFVFWFFFVCLRWLFLEMYAMRKENCLEFSHKQENQSGESEELFTWMLKMLPSTAIPGEIRKDYKAWEPIQLGKLALPSEPFKWGNRELNPRVLQSVGWKPVFEKLYGCGMVKCARTHEARSVFPVVWLSRSHRQMHMLCFPHVEGKDSILMPYLLGTEIVAELLLLNTMVLSASTPSWEPFKGWTHTGSPCRQSQFCCQNLMLILVVPTIQKLQGGPEHTDVTVLMPEVKTKGV